MWRTILYRKPLPSTSRRIRWGAASVTMKLWISLQGSTSSGKVLAKLQKLCRPTNLEAAALRCAMSQ